MSKRPALLNARFPTLLFSNGVGDHFLNLPAVRAVATLFPGRLTLICQSGLGRIFFYGIRFKSICEVPMTTFRGRRQFDADWVAGKVGPCDLLISLNPWHSSSVDRLLQCLAPDFSIGFSPEFKRQIRLNFRKHSAELGFDVVRALDRSLRLDDFSAAPIFPRHFVEQAQRVWRAFPSGFRVLAVHADTKTHKMWPTRRFIKLLDMFLERRPDFLALVVGTADLELDVGHHGSRVIPAYGLPLATSALLVAGSDLFVGIDSVMLHVADLFRVPGVGIFGPTSPDEWGFKFSPHRHVCAEGRMSTLSETTVLEALEQLLAATGLKSRSRV
jgi:hypothetical protein